MSTPRIILKLNASARVAGSHSRPLVDAVIDRLAGPETRIIDRDLAAQPPAFVDEAWIGANFTGDQHRTPAQSAALAESDALVAELKAADTLVIGAPMYNFGVPAALKAWIDQIARARVTFRYTPEGPQGLLTGKTAYLVVASGGTKAGSDADFVTDYLRHILGFIGIKDVTVITADQLMSDEAARLAGAHARIDALPIAASAPA